MPHVFARPLLATEHTEQDSGAEALAFAVAQRCGLPLRAVLPITSNPEYEALAPQIAAQAEALAGQRIAGLLADAQRAGVALEVQARRGPEAWREIVDEAGAVGADLVVTRRRGQRGLFANLLVGEMVRNVVAHAPCPVLVVPRGAAMWTRRVLAAIDPDGPDPAPATMGAAIAAECGLPLALVAVSAPSADAQHAARAALQRACVALQATGVTVETLPRTGRPHEQIVEAARQHGADLVVIGRHRDEGLAHAWLGGVAQKVIGLAEGPVLVVPSLATPPASQP